MLCIMVCLGYSMCVMVCMCMLVCVCTCMLICLCYGVYVYVCVCVGTFLCGNDAAEGLVAVLLLPLASEAVSVHEWETDA